MDAVVNVVVKPLPDQRFRAIWIELCRPQRANALSGGSFAGIAAAMERAATDDSIHAVMFTGAGERHFSGGADLTERSTSPQPPDFRRLLRDLLVGLFSHPKPVVGVINGVAVGAAGLMMLAFDRVAMVEDTFFALPEIDVKIPPLLAYEIMREFTSGAVAREVALSGMRLPASRCVELGIARAAVPRRELVATAERLAAELAAKPAEAYRAYKAHLGHHMSILIDETLGFAPAAR